jgi:hypothetical protein
VGRAEPNPINVELHHAWLAAMRGDAEQAGRHARACAELSERYAFPVFGLHAAVVAAWADAMLGDPEGVDRADAAYAAYLASGIRLFVPMYLLLRAEARAAAGDHGTAADLVAESRAASTELDDVCRSPRLFGLSNLLQGTRKP